MPLLVSLYPLPALLMMFAVRLLAGIACGTRFTSYERVAAFDVLSRPPPVCSTDLRVFSEEELDSIRSCVQGELKRHFGDFSEVEGTMSAAIDVADSDGSGEIQGPEVVRVIEAFVPEGLLADKRVRGVMLRLAWCM